MNYLTVENLTKTYGERLLFENITFFINEGDKVAFVAKNGSGKSSLLKILSGVEGADSGKIIFSKEIRIGYLDQDPLIDDHLTVFEAVYQSQNPVMQAIASYQKCMANPSDEKELQKALSDMDRLQAWDYDVKVKQILAKLDVHFFDKPIGVLSGGQRKRVALAKTLIDEPDFLILDEPTNHLDLDMIEWLEDYLKQSKLTLFIVTHDRYFLESVCDEILELDNQEIYKYKGSYSYFLQTKAERTESEMATTDRARNLYRKELDWMRRQPQARSTKAKARIDKFFEVEKQAKRQFNDEKIELDIQMQRLGSKIIELHHVKKSYPNQPILDDFDYKFKLRDRVGIVGKNGVGKTTLLNMIAGLEEPDGGKVVIGETVALGYYTQAGMQISDDKKVLDIIRDIAEYIPMWHGKKLYAEQLLERFLFPRKQQQNYVYTLSGGEKRRLYLLTILIRNPNFLILDEPTNDLDVMSLQVLEEFLMDYPGCLLIVSHDRQFMDKVVEHTFVLEGNGKVRDFPGNYSAYREVKAKEDLEAQYNKSAAVPVAATASKISYEQRKELNRIEREIAQLEQKRLTTTDKFNQANLSSDDFAKLHKELNDITKLIEEKEMRWLELNEEG